MTSYDPGLAVAVDDACWAEAIDLLDRAESVTLVCHVQPDADALGSMLALARTLRGRGVAVTCSWGDDPWSVPPGLRWLPDVDRCTPAAQVAVDPDLLVVLDTASRDRLGVLGGLATTAGQVLVIDHHAEQTDAVAGVCLVDRTAAATAVVVEELLRRMGTEPDADTATLLYSGLVTDTGSFAHPVTTPAVHGVAARLLAAGAQPDEITRRLWGTRTFAFTQLLGAALSRARLDGAALDGRGLVWTYTTAADLAAGIDVDELDHVMEPLRRTAEADVAVVVKEHADGVRRVSTRSRGGTDVGAACAALGGGGHRLAAGFTSYDDPDATIARFLDVVR